MNEPRTVRAFVEDLLTDGRTAEHILTVAINTHWATRIEEVKETLKEFSGILKKDFYFC